MFALLPLLYPRDETKAYHGVFSKHVLGRADDVKVSALGSIHSPGCTEAPARLRENQQASQEVSGGRLDEWVSGDAELHGFCKLLRAATRQNMLTEWVVSPSCPRNPFAALALALAPYRLKLSLPARLDTV